MKHTLGYSDRDIAICRLDEKPVVYGLQDIPEISIESTEFLACKEVVVCDEIGCGIVPIEQEERERRERIGRLCIALACRAEQVIRMTAGLPVRIK